MPPSKKPSKQTLFGQVVRLAGPYPPEAYELIQRGLSHTVRKRFGKAAPEAGPKAPKASAAEASEATAAESRHVSGQDLCEGLREYVLEQWGMMARAVLARWHITSTMDFGRIVFALVEADHLRATEQDSIEDFRDVYDFAEAFETSYRVPVAF